MGVQAAAALVIPEPGEVKELYFAMFFALYAMTLVSRLTLAAHKT